MNAVGKGMSQANFKRALENLKRSLSAPIAEPRDVSGIIKDFEMTYELSWKVLKKLLLAQGHSTGAARDVYAKAYQFGIIQNEAVWLQMIEDRNQTAHVYDEKDATEILKRIRDTYIQEFEKVPT